MLPSPGLKTATTMTRAKVLKNAESSLLRPKTRGRRAVECPQAATPEQRP